MFALTWCLLLYISARCYAFDLQVNTTAADLGQTLLEAKATLEQEPGRARQLTIDVPKDAIRLSTGTYIFNLRTMNWSEARSFCRSKGMDLVAIDSEEENAALSEYGKALGFFAPYNGAWTSGCYNNYHGKFIWHSTGKPLSYTKWWSNYPKEANLNEAYCIIFYPPDPRWWEVPTSLYLPAICEL